MKQILLMGLTFFLLATLMGCKKSESSSQTVNTTIAFEINDTTFQYADTYTFSKTTIGAPIEILLYSNYGTGRLSVEAYKMDTTPKIPSSLTMSFGFPFTNVTNVKTGQYTYVYTAPKSRTDTTDLLRAGNWFDNEVIRTWPDTAVLLSDTINIRALNGVFATGTFEATFATGFGGGKNLYVTQGTFTNAQIFTVTVNPDGPAN
jgi:hypothetical protein